MSAPHRDPFQRWHMRPARLKQTPKPGTRCSSPKCPHGNEALPDSPYCLHCHQLIQDRADELRAKAA